MSIAPTDPLAAQLAPSATAPIDQALLPADVRRGSARDKQTYQAALGFENMLLGQLTKSMMATAAPADDGSGSGSGASDSGLGLGSSSDPATSAYTQMLPDQLASSLTSAGGIGLADDLFRALKGTGR